MPVAVDVGGARLQVRGRSTGRLRTGRAGRAGSGAGSFTSDVELAALVCQVVVDPDSKMEQEARLGFVGETARGCK